MIITFGGSPGSGKTVVGNAVSQKLGYEMFDIGAMRREAARKKGMTLEEFNAWSEVHPQEGDAYFDSYVKETVSKKGNCIVVGRLAYFLFPNSLKIYLKVDVEVGAKRILEQRRVNDTRNEDPASSIEEQKRIMVVRMKSDTLRYKNLYNTDCYDEKNFDVVIDSTRKTIPQVIELVLSAVKNAK